jgi:predicted ATPase
MAFPAFHSSRIQLGRVTLLPAQRRVLVDDEPARLGGRAFDLLEALLSRRGEIVAKQELLDSVWPGIVVEENNLQVQICALRKLLGPETIVTVPGRGYALSAAVDEDAPDVAALAPTPGPTQAHAGATPLRGRADDLAAVSALLQEQRIVTVTGPGGVGKSRLVQDALSTCEGAATTVELAPKPERVSTAAWIARDFDLNYARAPSARQIAAALARTSALLLVENAEQGPDEVGELAEALLDHAPGMRLVCTSQVPLKARGEHVLRLAPLEVPTSDQAPDVLSNPALQLLRDAVCAVQPHEICTPRQIHDAVAISRHLDGVPLAIELAASRVPLLGIAGVRRMLTGDRFQLLTGGGRRTPARHRSLLACMEWSWGLLTERERAALAAVSRHAGGFTLRMARLTFGAAARSEWDAMELLGALVDKSLVLAEGGARSVFRVLETTRLFVQQRAMQESVMQPVSG